MLIDKPDSQQAKGPVTMSTEEIAQLELRLTEGHG